MGDGAVRAVRAVRAAAARRRGARAPGRRGAGGFPGSPPVSLGRKDLARLRAAPYLAALKSDGVRYVLMLTTRLDDATHPVALMIDRARSMYEVEVIAPEPYFVRGTVLEGELVWRQPDERDLLYLVFDAVRVEGEVLTARPFAERLARASRCVRLSEEIAADDDAEERAVEAHAVVLTHFAPRLTMRAKRFVDREHAARLWSERAEHEHRVDGLVLQARDAPYVVGSCVNGAAFKWKPHATVDLRGPEAAALEGPLPDELAGRTVSVAPSRVVATSDDDVLEYHVAVDDARVTLFAMRARTDKDAPNALHVVRATVEDVAASVGADDVAASE